MGGGVWCDRDDGRGQSGRTWRCFRSEAPLLYCTFHRSSLVTLALPQLLSLTRTCSQLQQYFKWKKWAGSHLQLHIHESSARFSTCFLRDSQFIPALFTAIVICMR